MKKLILALLVLSALFAALWSSAQSSNFKIIVHKDNPVESLSAKDISNLLLKKKTKWDSDGFKVAADPIDLEGGSETRESFSREVHGRSVSSIKSYWQRQIFSGREVPPPEVKSEAEVVAYVSQRPGGIGYISGNTRTDDDVKELSISN